MPVHKNRVLAVISNGKLLNLFVLKLKSITFELEPQILILMKTAILLVLCTFFSYTNSYSQEINFYKNAQGDTHICGEFPLDYLEHDSNYSIWFNKYYNELKLPEKRLRLKSKLKKTTVDIYLGTWCGDSKKWVPQFIKLWDELGLKRSQLRLIGLYNDKERYKTSPDGEEQGQQIHRVPVFVFKKDNVEYARIVETPKKDLVTDVAQIALGFPSAPNYEGANYLFKVFDSESIESIKENFNAHYKILRDKTRNSRELNTLGYVLLRNNRTKEALICFELNTYLFKYNPNVYDSFGEALALSGEHVVALKMYEKVLEIDPENKNAMAQIKHLEALIGF
jgi:tetratricopeptide (TPR) repeat protein